MGCSLAIKRASALTKERNPAEMQEIFMAVCPVYRAIHAQKLLCSSAKSGAGCTPLEFAQSRFPKSGVDKPAHF
jgi:hypothetical protein